jgi:hypothetical protein
MSKKIKLRHTYARLDEQSLNEAVEYLSSIQKTHDRAIYSDFRLRYINRYSYDSDSQEMAIVCDRLENDVEHAARDQRDLEAKYSHHKRNLAEYERLKKELGL